MAIHRNYIERQKPVPDIQELAWTQARPLVFFCRIETILQNINIL